MRLCVCLSPTSSYTELSEMFFYISVNTFHLRRTFSTLNSLVCVILENLPTYTFIYSPTYLPIFLPTYVPTHMYSHICTHTYVSTHLVRYLHTLLHSLNKPVTYLHTLLRSLNKPVTRYIFKEKSINIRYFSGLI